MKNIKTMNKSLCLGMLAVCGFGFTSTASAQWNSYETFNSPTLSPVRWNVVEPGADGRWMEEVERWVGGGKLKLSVRSASEPDTNTGSTKVRNRMFMQSAKQSGLIGMQLDLVVKKAVAKACAGNSDVSAARFLMENTYFNTGGSSGPGDAVGDIYTYMEARVAQGSLGGAPVEILARALRCEDADCTATTTLFSQSLGFTTLKTSTTLKSFWKPAKQQIKWTAKFGGVTRAATYDYATDLTVGGAPAKRDLTNGFQVRNEVANCDMTAQSLRPTARFHATVDNVIINKQ